MDYRIRAGYAGRMRDPGAIRCCFGARATRSPIGLLDPRRAGTQYVDAPRPGPERDRVFYRRPYRHYASVLARESALGPELGVFTGTVIKERDRRAPRSSILAQLGGVALLAERDPRHPVIGDWSGRSTGGAACIMGGQPTGLPRDFQGSTAPVGQPCDGLPHAAARRRTGGSRVNRRRSRAMLYRRRSPERITATTAFILTPPLR